MSEVVRKHLHQSAGNTATDKCDSNAYMREESSSSSSELRVEPCALETCTLVANDGRSFSVSRQFLTQYVDDN